MVFIIGGAYQGKLDFARVRFDLSQEDIFRCTGAEIDFSRRCVSGLEQFTLECARVGLDPVDYFRQHRTQWQESILLCEDMSCGVVPIDALERQWRQDNGRLCQYLAKNARQVSRIFCGLEQRLK